MVAPGYGYGIVAMAALGYGGPQSNEDLKIARGTSENQRRYGKTLKEDLEVMDMDWSDETSAASDRANWRQIVDQCCCYYVMQRRPMLCCYKCTKYQFIHLLTATCND